MLTLPQFESASTGVGYVIGIGASAGGLEAINELFDNMPSDTNFSFVIIQHLSPDHKSLMPELLSKHTSLPIYEARNNMVLEPNRIYLLPSKKTMTVKNGELILEDKKEHQPNFAVDIFFESLASYKGNLAVGIVLSGTGTDGSKGVQCIKNSGGIVVIQDPATAAFNGMPNSAIATGCADLILPSEMIPYELIEYINEFPLIRTFNQFNNHDEAILEAVLDLVYEKMNYDFRHYKRPTINRRLARRMQLKNFTTLSDYFNHLKENEEEVRALCKDFVINVTRFFRDEEAFAVLKNNVIPSLFFNKEPGDIIKVWVVACSTGEEAYSLAILFQEYIELHKKVDITVKIFATDIDEEAIMIASRGIYPTGIGNDVSGDRLARFFLRENNLYQVVPTIRKMVVFAKHDVTKDPPYSKLDLLSCRNLLIYMNPSLQKHILQKFHFAMREHSFLFLGPSENISILKDSMKEVDKKWKLYQCVKRSSVTNYDHLISPSRKTSASRGTNPKAKDALNNLSEIFKETLLEEYDYAGIYVDVNFEVKQAIGKFKNYLGFPESNLNLNLLKLVPPDLSIVLSTALRRALKDNEKVVVKKVKIKDGRHKRLVNIIIKPYLERQRYLQPFLFIILSEEKELKRSSRIQRKDKDTCRTQEIEELQYELQTTKESLQSIIEELETTNEELQSSNEEIVSSNEELQSTNEELQSLNEELHTVNAEHQLKIRELIELNDDFNNYFRNTDIGQILIDKDLIIKKFTPAVAKQVNLINADVGRSITHISINFKNDFIADITKVIKTNQPVEKEIMTGEENVFLMRITPYVRQDKTTDGVVVNFIDVTEIKRLHSLIRAIFNSSTSAIVAQKPIKNEAGDIIDFEIIATNDTVKKIFGIFPNELVGGRMSQHFSILMTDHSTKLNQVINTGQPAHFEYYRAPQKLWLEVIAVKMWDGIVATFNDITERKKAEDLLAKRYEEIKVTSDKLLATNQKLEESNLDLLQFASVASHDLKEPLRKIEAFGNLLKEKIRDKLNDQEQRYLEKIVQSAGRMQALIEDILTLSKLSNSNVARKPVKLDDILRNIVDDLEVTIQEKKANITVGDLPEIMAIPGQMHQLFQNLLTNALKFNQRDNPLIVISRKEIGEELRSEFNLNGKKFGCITVSDNGIGFEPQYSEKIFGIFQRLDGKQYEGTGIGLAICKKIVENHRGFIKADGRPGEGSVFTILLPEN